MASSRKNKQVEKQTDSCSELEYLHKIGLTDMTAEDLRAPKIENFGTRTSDDFELLGADVHPKFEYYRATGDLSIRKAEEIGYIQLPSQTDVRFKGCHTKDEVMMARLKTVGDAHRKQEHARRQALKSGTTTGQTPMGGAVFNEKTERSQMSVPIQER